MKKNSSKRPKIVVIGGGTGLPVILKSLKNKNIDITAIVTTADDGGSSGILRNYIDMVPPGDIRNVMDALSNLPKVNLNLFQYRFKSKDQFFAGHPIGNLIIAALSEMNGGIFNAVKELSRIMKVDGHVYPATEQKLVLHAKFKDGSQVDGESEITNAHGQIKRVWVTTTNGKAPKAIDPVIKAIHDADQIVLGPGSLFTSILPELMINNLGKAIINANAQVVYICNIMAQNGETNGFSDADHVKVLNQHLKHHFIDMVFVNNKKVPKGYIDQNKWDEYNQQITKDPDELRKHGCKFIYDDFLDLHDHGAFHNGDKVVKKLLNIL
nr:uridine diphosphate-N-acetylglucosamine-binding protein YvcK [Philodulcilactobacillus myokoensis]